MQFWSKIRGIWHLQSNALTALDHSPKQEIRREILKSLQNRMKQSQKSNGPKINPNEPDKS